MPTDREHTKIFVVLRRLLVDHYDLLQRHRDTVRVLSKLSEKPVAIHEMSHEDAKFWVSYIENLVKQEKDDG